MRVDEDRYGHHHSSMTGGDVVRCAGMIAGVGGKIAWLDNNSGHFTSPRSNILFRFASFLNSRGVFSVDAQVKSGGWQPKTEPVKVFLTNQARARKCRPRVLKGGAFRGANVQNRETAQGNFLRGRANG